jgi:hypothetical protein
VTCPDCGHPVVYAKVKLIKDGCVVAVDRTDKKGYFCFDDASRGTYKVQVCSSDFETTTSDSFYFNDKDNVTLCLSATPKAIGYTKNEVITGRVFFSDSPYYQSHAVSGVTLTKADLSNPAYASADFSQSYLYTGYIPNFPELGYFDSSHPIWVIIQQPLVDTKPFVSSFTNLVGVKIGSAANYTQRMFFNQPFIGPGTAHCYTLTQLELFLDVGGTPVPNPSPQPSICLLKPVWVGDGCSPWWPPPCGDLPAGWMARALVEFTVPPSTHFVAYIDGCFYNACCDQTCFRIHPEASTPPEAE